MKYLIMTALLSFAACSSKPDIKEFPKSASAKEEISNLELALETSKENDYDLLAPESFTAANTNLRVAKQLQNDEYSKEAVLKEVGQGQGYLEQAEEISAENKVKLEEILAARQSAITAKADKLFPDKLGKIDNKLKEETAKLEKDKDNKIKERKAEFVTEYTKLGVAAKKLGAEVTGPTDALAAENIAMSKELELNEAYESARMKFTEEEAEVYKQGSNLVIRLRALEFPKSEAVLKGDNFPLLKKVEEVIESFDKSHVIVEGHTDSTGAQSLNQKLSEERADAVKKYLEVNTDDSVSEIEAQGFGYEKPLSSNKTASGRAQNRRVDVIIEPVQL